MEVYLIEIRKVSPCILENFLILNLQIIITICSTFYSSRTTKNQQQFGFGLTSLALSNPNQFCFNQFRGVQNLNQIEP